MARLATAALVLALAAVAAAQCTSEGAALLTSCSAELETVQQTYTLAAPAPPTGEQVSSLSSQVSATPGCCDPLKTFLDAGCYCDQTLPNALGGIGLPATATGLQGVLTIIATACKITPPTC